MENEERASKSYIAMRCSAKAAMLLLRLKSIQRFTDEEMQKRKIYELKIQLLKKRSNNKIKLCTLLELIVQLLLLLSVWTFFFVIFVKAFGAYDWCDYTYH
ncbi:hypothetical protein TanjilG_02801 [Lupinus angustifolius]|uniref:Transmembrane protein n=1 Tax=Lupinus angustifolius TaxID=3871 RepID=A0A1J7HUU8_LUPAN|nr:hypothetical protein TanjilG_02801 [Lupinus angustifolius]